jgi:hypothetical protein
MLILNRLSLWLSLRNDFINVSVYLICVLLNIVISEGAGLGNREYGHGIRRADYATPSIRKSWLSLGRYSSLAD